jgi:hypothetical protein
VLFFLDADVVLAPDALRRVAAHFRDERAAEAMIGSYDDEPAAPNFLSQYRNLLHHYVHQNAKDTVPTFWGACGAIRREAFHAVGGFDEEYDRPCIEDVEFGLRLKKADYTVRMRPSVQVKHLKRWTATSVIKTDTLDRALPWSLLLLESQELPDSLNLRVKERWSTVAVFLMLASAVGALAWAPAAVCAALSAGTFIGLNAPLYRFFRDVRGTAFAAKAIPWHAVYYVCCGVGAGLGGIVYGLSSMGIRPVVLHRLLPRPVQT